MMYRETYSSRFVCNSQICEMQNYNMRQKQISLRQINPEEIQNFYIVQFKKRKSFGYSYAINAKYTSGEKKRFFPKSTSSENETKQLIDKLNKTIHDPYKDIDEYFPHSINEEKAKIPLYKFVAAGFILLLIYFKYKNE